MTRRVIHDLGCVCGRHFRRPLYHALNVTQQPGLRYAVLAGVLNVVQCPSCERIARVNLPFLYTDSARGHFVYLYPEEVEEQAEALQSQIVRMVGALEAGIQAQEGLPRPTLMFGLEQLAEMVAAGLSDDEQPGALTFDARPGIKPERAARVLAGRLAVQLGGFVHSWREGHRLHLQVLGPSAAIQQVVITAE